MGTTEYIILAKNQHYLFIFHSFNAKLPEKYSKISVWQLYDICKIFDLINFQNNQT